ncbi:unnamed protein product, partial [Allacma fusca]
WWREGSEATISIGAKLNIVSAKVSSEGIYYCQPSNDGGMGTVASVDLRVYQGPRFLSTLQSQVIRRSGDGNFSVSCTAEGKPRPNVTWVKDGTLINPKIKHAFYRISTRDVDVRNGVT